ncbi:MAG TPA: hypothetical protein VJC13_00290 [Candidatus Paceibacterota bacterium]|nr:hypothetical protein [uncultured archaeon]
MNDDEIKDDAEVEDDVDLSVDDDDSLTPGKKKSKGLDGDDSLDELAEEEDAILPEDEFDDKDLW